MCQMRESRSIADNEEGLVRYFALRAVYDSLEFVGHDLSKTEYYKEIAIQSMQNFR